MGTRLLSGCDLQVVSRLSALGQAYVQRSTVQRTSAQLHDKTSTSLLPAIQILSCTCCTQPPLYITLEEIQYFKSLQSYRYFTSGWVLETQWKEYCEEEKVVVQGKVRHSYAASKSLLKPWVIIRTNGTVEVAHCTCMAGSAEICSHIGAILHWVETAVHIGNVTPCTSLENKWLVPAPVQDIPRLHLKDIDFSAPKCQPIVPSYACIPGRSRRLKLHGCVKLKKFSI